ncbi:hypothetical protein F4775DRAFT_607034 [Biscogniauxia sp. FL1348]|nr:hypothetical protein F4775DRAFT_607034 [Biscogniauxia sp. FL1348]
MDDEVERLMLAPFREIVEKSNAAIENAGAADETSAALMLRAAQSLMKEGERALKRLEPLCIKNYEEYGSNFIDAIKENDEIAQYRSELEDLLWDFDDFIEPDEFDAEKFDELQKASRKAAPKVLDILRRMKLVAPALTTSSSQPSRPVSVVPDMVIHRTPHEQIPTSMTTDPLSPTVEELMEELGLPPLSSMMSTVAGPDEGLEGTWEAQHPSIPRGDVGRSNSNRSGGSDAVSEPPPRPPSVDPWQVDRALLSPGEYPDDEYRWGPRPAVPGDSPTIPPAQPVSPRVEPASPLPSRKPGEDVDWMQKENDEHDRRMRAASQSQGTPSEGSRSPLQNNRWTGSTQDSSDSTPSSGQVKRTHSGFINFSRSLSHSSEKPGLYGRSPRDSVTNHSLPSDTSSVFGPPSAIPENTAVASNGHHSPTRKDHALKAHSLRQHSTESVNSSVFDVVECMNPTSPVTSASAHRDSIYSTTSGNPYSPNGQPLPTAFPGSPPTHPYSRTTPSMSSSMTVRNHSSSTLTVQPSSEATRPAIGLDEGLIPVHVDSPTSSEPPMPTREADCTIGPFSSFYKLKGFCKGAEEAMRGQLGFKKIKRPVGGFSMAIVAKCTHCLYELDYKSIEQDLNNDSCGTFRTNSIGFRLRVLQKSHLPIRHVEEQLYGCLFCIQQGHTVEESDSTVFFNQRQLFAHMARHPRPLPEVPGLTVVEEPEIPPNIKDNFDLHFPHPPVQSVMTGISQEIARLPMAVATESRKNSNGIMRTPPDRTAVLHFAVGAKIVGVEFPAKYEGKWAIGWHDGVRAAFEVESVQIDAPPKGQVKMQGTSNVQAVARWKWNQKGDDRWLKFDKGDIIKNIAWAYTDHWCWSGTTAKGWGIFPQSHLDPNSIKTVQPGDTASVSSWEKKGPLRFSLRKNADRKSTLLASIETPSIVPFRTRIH